MVESWRQLMDVGLIHFMAYPAATEPPLVQETVRKLALDGFWDVLEIKRVDAPGVHDELRAIAEQSGISYGMAAQPNLLGGKLSLNDSDDAARQAAVNEVKKSIDAAYALDAKITAVLSGKDPGDADRAHQMDLLVNSCVELCQYAESKATDYVCWISLEAFDEDIDKACLIGPSERAAELAARVREQMDNFGITIDLSHLPLLRESPGECLSQLADYVIHTHAGNCVMADESDPAYGDMHPRFGYPGGENDVAELKEYVESLIYAGYFQAEVPTAKPVLSFEVKPVGDEDSDLIVAQTKRTWRRMWAEL